MTPDTIAAIATPPGRGGIGILRLSGPDALRLALALIDKDGLAPRKARFCRLLDPESGEKLDEAVLTYFPSPRSYTGEEVVEIAAHGAPVVLHHLLRLLLARGARLADPGEFTERAFLSGRLDLTQAEAVRALVDAQTLVQAQTAAAQLGGSLARRIAPLKRELLALIAQMEAGIDFAEDDTPVLAAADLRSRLGKLGASLGELQNSFTHGRLLAEGAALAIVGRPNAGKSSLFNRLLERDRSIVTAEPGTTRDTVSERLAIAGIPVELIDTAGLRDAYSEPERMGVLRSREALADAGLVLLVLDATAPLNDEERALLRAAEGRPLVIARNKADLHPEHASEPAPAAAGILRAPEPPGNTAKSSAPELISGIEPAGPLASPATGVEPAVPHAGPNHAGLNRAGLLAAGQPSRTAFDRGAGLDHALLQELAPAARQVRTSALTGEGLDALRDALATALTGGKGAGEGAPLTSLRQHSAVAAAARACAAAQMAATEALPHELILLDLHAAREALDALTGATTPDDILRQIFSSFCIGK